MHKKKFGHLRFFSKGFPPQGQTEDDGPASRALPPSTKGGEAIDNKGWQNCSNAPPIFIENSCYHYLRWAKASNLEVLNTNGTATGNLVHINRLGTLTFYYTNCRILYGKMDMLRAQRLRQILTSLY